MISILQVVKKLVITIYFLRGAPDVAQLVTSERMYPLAVLGKADDKHQDVGQQKGLVSSRSHVADDDMFVEDIASSKELEKKDLQVAKPELAVLEGVGCDVIRAAEMKQKEWRPEGCQPVIARHGAEGEVAKGVYRGGVSQQVC
ncbi:Os04g0137550 [Oryza sativa Japonica Group]|uniref:Os04g0137550 protein n=1 Tax=Oryza sativa subsp. japonica TaxID=39947 RepID=A0A0N7KII9_ORYSJ|nr:Os04g0137550 [Oryza sativa Japonica Group]